MDITRIQDSIRKCSSDTERIYTRIGSCFPSLLSITASSASSSFENLLTLFGTLARGFSDLREDENSFIDGYNRKNSELFSNLNGKMTAIERINERVAAIRSDSEELEIISLNAMVISIKSGEKGRAFSCITENLKRLSASMITLSNALILDEKKLAEKNEALKLSYTAVGDAQQNMVNHQGGKNSALVVPLIQEATTELYSMKETASSVVKPIQNAMAGVQLQDIIRQSNDQIVLAFADLDLSSGGTADERLDRYTFDVELLDICLKIARDIIADIDVSRKAFSDNWGAVHRILDDVERIRASFLQTYLGSSGPGAKSLPLVLDGLARDFTDYIAGIGSYQRGQRTMVRDSAMIVSEVKHLRALFDTIRPIIARLQHVRITQQIEVAKNPAIAAVKDTVEYMSDLIMKADERVQETRKELEQFIDEIEELTSDYTATSAKDSRELEQLKQDKTAFLDAMRAHQDELVSLIVNFRVYPDSFASSCAEVDALIAELDGVSLAMGDLAGSVESCRDEYVSLRDSLLAETGRQSWQIHNDRFKELVEQFTITSHKEAAGKIAGLEGGGAESAMIASGDVTLFF
jgi:hypothetical protein